MIRTLVKMIIVLLFALLPISASLAATEANEFILMYSNNVNGETEPCG